MADVSSYDPEFGDWEFGKLSALREIAFALEEGYKYYYMGMFYLACVLYQSLTYEQATISIPARRCDTKLSTGHNIS